MGSFVDATNNAATNQGDISPSKQSVKGVKFFSEWGATSREAKAQDLLSKAEFDTVFSGGNLIQPTPHNKPISKVTICQHTGSKVKALLGTAADALKGELWVKGGAPSRGFGMFGGGGFAEGRKKGSDPLDVSSMKVTYSADTQKLSVVMSVLSKDAEDGSDDCCYW